MTAITTMGMVDSTHIISVFLIDSRKVLSCKKDAGNKKSTNFFSTPPIYGMKEKE